MDWEPSYWGGGSPQLLNGSVAFLGIEHGDNATHFVRDREGNATPHGTNRAHDLSLYLPISLSTLLILSYVCALGK